LIPHAFSRWTGLVGISLALLVAGCVTREQVASIVAQSNAAMISSQLGDLPQKDGEKPGQSWMDSNQQIEAFVAAHPDQPEITAPLRVRQAMLLLSNKQINLAQAAFDSVAETDLHTARDQTLKRNAGHLVWWFSHSANDTWTAVDQTQASNALKALAESQDSLSDSPDIRDYLAEMRAWIGLSSAKQTTRADEARKRLEDALDTYARIFSAHDLEVLQNGNEQLPDSKALTSDVRRRVRARIVLTAAQKQNHADALGAHPANTTFDALINRAP